MIPKTIHYCWFGGSIKPKTVQRCIRSWKRKCPDYTILEWNDESFDISACPTYVQQAYNAKKWAFVTDYARLKVVYETGGIYLDTDVELLKNPSALLDRRAFFGFEDGKYINTGLGFGSEKGVGILLELMNQYQDIPFVLPDGTFDTKTCPMRNTEVFLKHGLIQDNNLQVLEEDILILPKDYLSPITYPSKEKHITKNTISIHWFAASWQTKEEKEIQHDKLIRAKQQRKTYRIDRLKHTPNRIIKRLLGQENYQKVKELIKARKCR